MNKQSVILKHKIWGVCGMAKQEEIMAENFISYEDILQRFQEKWGSLFKKELLDLFIEKALVACFEYGNVQYIYDIVVCERLMQFNIELSASDYAFVGYSNDLFIDFIKLGEGTYLRYPLVEEKKWVPVFVKNVLYLFSDYYKEGEECQFDFLGMSVVTSNQLVSAYISQAIYRKRYYDKIKLSNFANTSAYMGSKQGLVGFIVESIWPHHQGNMPILDIMCGSGSATNAFAQLSKVYASDAQYFCQLLARVQGRGFNIDIVEKLQNSLFENYKKNMKLLQSKCIGALEKEKKIFYMDTRSRSDLAKDYLDFIQSFDLFSSTECTSESVEVIIRERKCNHKKLPYCLFTYYFSNIYFGLEQCNQIDSIRYAIDMIEDDFNKEWLLGILIVSVTSVASNYAGHFAQPKKIDESSVYNMIKKRRRSVWLEFSKRLRVIAAESEHYAHEIVPVEGPWERALQDVKKREKNILVYLDAPYKREEYSRYYHVLETLVRYDYPAAERKGRLRSIKNGERFKSNFSSRNVKKIEDYFVYVITNILKEVNVCAWSYSNNATANIIHIIENIRKVLDCQIYIYTTMYRHAAQGKNAKKKDMNVIEYCIVFVKT